jgi:hypothetical protein
MGFGIKQNYDPIEYLSPTRQKIRRLLADWSEEIREKKKEMLTEQQQKDIKRESHEISRIISIFAEVCIDPKLDSGDPHYDDDERFIL